MSYTRKTRDEFEIAGDYGQGDGFECVTTETTLRAAREQVRTYRENEPGIPFKIITRRVRINKEA